MNDIEMFLRDQVILGKFNYQLKPMIRSPKDKSEILKMCLKIYQSLPSRYQ